MTGNPDITAALQEGVALHQAGRLAEAEARYRAILEDAPAHADALHLLGLIAFQEGRLEEALAGIERAVEINGAVAMYHGTRGRILKALGRDADAASAFAAALRLQPGDAAVLSDLAGALVDAGDAEAAQQFARRAGDLAPELAAAPYTEGLALAALKETGPAENAFRRALERDPRFAAASHELGAILQQNGDLAGAERQYREAIANDPALGEAMTNLGNVLRADGRLEEAVKYYRRALETLGEIATVRGNLGVALQELGDTDAAIAAYDKALATEPADAEIRRNRAQALLQKGQFEEGWREFEWRWKTRHFAAIRRDWKQPQWAGETLPEATVLVHSEQGFGDCIQFARYLPMLGRRVGRVVLECPAPVAGLMTGLDGVDDVILPGAPLPAYDRHVPLMSLPGAFATGFDTIPAAVPYLSVAAASETLWGGRVGGGAGLRVGVVWKGSHKHQRNRWRSPGIEVLRPLLSVPGVRFVSLQKDDEDVDLRKASLAGAVQPLGQDFRNFTDTAATIRNLDLVIAPDTAVAHLAGALARPVWLMLPHVGEWRWLEERTDSPWYPSMRIYRQPARGDWDGVVEAMAVDLAALAKG